MLLEGMSKIDLMIHQASFLYFRHGGCNNNPSARIVKSSFRSILSRAGCKPGNTGNVIPLDDSSVPEPITDEDFDNVFLSVNETASEFKDQVIYYIGGFIVRKSRQTPNFCDECSEVLMDFTNAHESATLTRTKDCGWLYYPSSDLCRLLNVIEKLINCG